MLTFPSAYSTALASSFKDNWIFRIYDKDDNYIGLSFANVTMNDSVAYTGAILNSPSIRDRVDFSSGKSSSGNITLEVSDFTISAVKLSKKLYTGNYINQNVKAYSTLNSNTTMANAVQIFTGRLTSIDFTETEKIKLSIVIQRPWDNIDLPNETSDTGVYVPVVYGDYTGHTTADFMTSKALYPSPKTSSANGNFYFLAPKSESTPVINTYDSRADMFANLDLDTNATVTKDGQDAFEVDGALLTTYKFRPQAVVSGSGFTNPENAINTSTVDYASQTHDVTNGGSQTTDLKLELPSISGKFTSATLYLTGQISISSFVDSGSITLYDYSFGSLTTITARNTSSGTGTTALATSFNILSSITGNSNRLPDSIVLRLASSSLDDIATSCRINDVWLYLVHTVDSTNEPTASGEAESKLQVVYSGNDGFEKSWSAGNVATAPHDIHRDILHRFLGGTTTPTVNNGSAWSVIEGAKSGSMRFFTEPNKSDSLKNYLDKLAYEGGFVFRFDSQNNPVYHYIEDSPSADITLTHSDVIGLSIGHTSLGELITKWVVQYEKNPAGSEYKQKTTHTSSVRTNFFPSGSKENVKDVKLNFLVSDVDHTDGDRNATFLDYYNDILGEPKQTVSFEIVNPTKSNIEVGDVVSFSSMKVNPLSGDWSTVKFIVTSTNRRVGGQVSVQTREI